MSENNWAVNSQDDINSPEFGEGEPKKDQKAICNARQALQIAQKLSYNDIERDLRRARVLSAFNGSPPYCDSELISKAQGYRQNVSLGYMEGVIGRSVVPYNSLTINISDLTEIKANLPDDKLKTIQVEFGKIMDKWGRWPKFVTRLNQDLVLNGYNSVIFPSDYDPFPTFVSQKHGFVDEGSPNDVLDLEVYVWRKSYMIHELYAKISEEDIATKAGWNVKNVKQALTDATPESIYNKNLTTSGQWTAVQEAIRQGSSFVSIVGAKMIDTYHVFATELDGKVTHYVVLDSTISDNDVGKDSEPDRPELFKKDLKILSSRLNLNEEEIKNLDYEELTALIRTKKVVDDMARRSLGLSDSIDVTSKGQSLGESLVSAIQRLREDPNRPKLSEDDKRSILEAEIVDENGEKT